MQGSPLPGPGEVGRHPRGARAGEGRGSARKTRNTARPPEGRMRSSREGRFDTTATAARKKG